MFRFMLSKYAWVGLAIGLLTLRAQAQNRPATRLMTSPDGKPVANPAAVKPLALLYRNLWQTVHFTLQTSPDAEKAAGLTPPVRYFVRGEKLEAQPTADPQIWRVMPTGEDFGQVENLGVGVWARDAKNKELNLEQRTVQVVSPPVPKLAVYRELQGPQLIGTTDKVPVFKVKPEDKLSVRWVGDAALLGVLVDKPEYQAQDLAITLQLPNAVAETLLVRKKWVNVTLYPDTLRKWESTASRTGVRPLPSEPATLALSLDLQKLIQFALRGRPAPKVLTLTFSVGEVLRRQKGVGTAATEQLGFSQRRAVLEVTF